MLRRIARFACTIALGAGCAGSIGEPSGTTSPPDDPRPPNTPGNPAPIVPNAPVDPKTCAAPTTRIWKLTPEQYTRTVQSLLGSTTLRPGDELANTLAARKHGFSNEAAALDLSEPHVGALLESSRKLAGLVLADAKVWTCGTTPAEACVRTFLETFGARAFRRPLSPAELDTYTGFFRKEAAAHDPATAARLLTTALFMSPSFVFRTELGADGAKPGQAVTLTPYEKASALSYFLTDGPPDAELWNAAKAGQLETREQLAAQAKRLVGSAAVAAGVTRFLNEHFDTQAVKLARKDTKVYADWKADLQADMAKEGELFLQQVAWKEDGKLSTLLTAGFSMLNSRLAVLYGVTGPAAPTSFEKVMLPGTRAGFLTQPGMMSTLSRENDTDPVMRGRFVREALLCQPPPSPPPDVNAVPPPPDGKSTQRERLANHSKDPLCATCHKLLDPLGLAFEHYDGIGKYRLMDVGRPIDATGALIAAQPEGAKYANAVELMNVLAKSPDVAGCFVAKSYQWAHGRAPTEADACALQALAKRFGETGGAITDLMIAVVSDDSFFTRRAP